MRQVVTTKVAGQPRKGSRPVPPPANGDVAPADRQSKTRTHENLAEQCCYRAPETLPLPPAWRHIADRLTEKVLACPIQAP